MRCLSAFLMLSVLFLGLSGCSDTSNSKTVAKKDPAASSPAASGGGASSVPSSGGGAPGGMGDMAGMSGDMEAGIGGPPGMEDMAGSLGEEETMAGMEDFPGGYPGAPDGAGIPGSEGEDITGGYPGMEGMPGYGGGQQRGAASKQPQSFSEYAERAFDQGKDKEANLYLHAAELTKSAGPGLRWVAALKRPALVTRWGVGINYSAPKGFSEKPNPIRKEAASGNNNRGQGPDGFTGSGAELNPASSQGGRRRGYGRGRNRAKRQPPKKIVVPQQANAKLDHYTGELGEKVLEYLQEKIQDGSFGVSLVEIPIKAAPKSNAGGGSGYPGGADFDPAGGEAGFDSAGFDSAAGGLDIDSAGEGFSGAGGAGFPGAGKAKNNSNQLLPCVTMLGEGKLKELLENAKKEEIDVLLVYKVTAKRRGKTVSNSTRIMLYEVASGEEILAIRPLLNYKVAELRKKSGDDPVEKGLQPLFQFIDESLVMTDLPQGLNPDNVAGRISKMVTEPYQNPLPLLSEIRFYSSKKLLDQNVMLEALATVIGDVSTKSLLSGSEKEKQKTLLAWLPKDTKLAEEKPKQTEKAKPTPGAAVSGGVPGSESSSDSSSGSSSDSSSGSSEDSSSESSSDSSSASSGNSDSASSSDSDSGSSGAPKSDK